MTFRHARAASILPAIATLSLGSRWAVLHTSSGDPLPGLFGLPPAQQGSLNDGSRSRLPARNADAPLWRAGAPASSTTAVAETLQDAIPRTTASPRPTASPN